MELNDTQHAKINKIANQYKIADIYLFGSEVTGFKHPGSDFDIAVRFRKGLPSLLERGKVYGNLYSDLLEVFGREDLDLVFTEESPLHIRFRIVAEGELLYSFDRENSFDYKERVINYYRDYKFFIDEYFSGVSIKNN